MSVHMLDHSNSQGPHESDVNKNILLTLQKYSKCLYFSKLICQQLICQQLFLRGALKFLPSIADDIKSSDRIRHGAL